MSTTKKKIAKKATPLSRSKTLVTIHPDGIITVEKSEDTLTEQVILKAAHS